MPNSSHINILIGKSKLLQQLTILRPDYHEKALKLIEQSQPYLEKIVDIFPYYTNHNIIHSLQVLVRMEQILDKDALGQFNEDALFVLVASSILHDIGMAFLYENDKSDFLGKNNIDENDKVKIQNILRKMRRNEKNGRLNHLDLLFLLLFSL